MLYVFYVLGDEVYAFLISYRLIIRPCKILADDSKVMMIFFI